MPPIVSALTRATESNTREVGDIGNRQESDRASVDASYNMMPQQEFLSASDFGMDQLGWPVMDWDISGSSSW